MRNDQIFVLLLVILLPMSGCFDGAVGDAEGTDDTSSGTTVINNYYNNSTSLQEPVLQHIYSESNDNIVATISITSNQALEIVSANAVIVWNDSYSNNNPGTNYAVSVTEASCYNGTEPVENFPFTSTGLVWKGPGSCDYTLGTYFGENFGTSYSSIFYRIHSIG